MKILLNLICLTLVLIVTGCKTTDRHVRWYPGPQLDTNQIALLKVQWDFGGPFVPVNKINGEPLVREKGVGNNTREIELLPGRYDLSVGYFTPDARSISDILINFTAEAGRVYQLRAAAEEKTFGQSLRLAIGGGTHGWTAWIVETGTGAVVAGRPRKTPLKWHER